MVISSDSLISADDDEEKERKQANVLGMGGNM